MKEKLAEVLRILRLLPKAVSNSVKKQTAEQRRKRLLELCGAALVFALVLGTALFFLRRGEAKPREAAVSSRVRVSVLPEIKAPVSITLSFAGDCTLGTDKSFGYAGSFPEMYDVQGAAYFLGNVREIFEADDLTVVNFEGTLTDSDCRAEKKWAFKGPKEYVEILTSASVEAANLANNHTCDYGEKSFSDTHGTLTEAGIRPFGFEETAVIDVKGVKVGLLGMYTVYEDETYTDQLRARIEELQEQGAQVIVANFHWGLEKGYTPEEDQVELAHAAIDAGAHLVIGHHPHVLQGVEVYKGRYIVYSLGNFCFGGNNYPPDFDCMIFQQTFTVENGSREPKTDDRIQVIPCAISSRWDINDYRPTPAGGEAETRILEKLRKLSQGLGERNIFAQSQE